MGSRDVYGFHTKHDSRTTLPTFTNVDVFRDCANLASSGEELGPPPTAASRTSSSARRLLKEGMRNVTPGMFEEVWAGLSAWVAGQLVRGRAVNIPHFFKVSFEATDGTRPMSQLSSPRGSPRGSPAGEPRGKPILILADDFILEHGVLFKTPIAPGAKLASGVPIVDLQYSALAVASGVDKDMCVEMIKLMTNVIGATMGRGALVAVELVDCGIISAVGKSASFLPSVPRPSPARPVLRPRQLARLAGNPHATALQSVDLATPLPSPTYQPWPPSTSPAPPPAPSTAFFGSTWTVLPLPLPFRLCRGSTSPMSDSATGYNFYLHRVQFTRTKYKSYDSLLPTWYSESVPL